MLKKLYIEKIRESTATAKANNPKNYDKTDKIEKNHVC